MNSLAPGKNTSVIEVTNISAHGIRVLVQDKERFMSYEDFPWFKDQTVKTITNVVEQSLGHFDFDGGHLDHVPSDIVEQAEPALVDHCTRISEVPEVLAYYRMRVAATQ
jgi:hypothetical protein